MVCPLCADRRVLVDDTDGTHRPCPFHDGAQLVAADPAALDALREALLDDERQRVRILENLVEATGGMPASSGFLLDWTRQHQFEPAGLTTPNRYQIDVPLRRLPPRNHPRLNAVAGFVVTVALAFLAYLILRSIGALFS